MCRCQEKLNQKGEKAVASRQRIPSLDAPSDDMAEKTPLISLGLKPGSGVAQSLILPRGIASAEEINRTIYIDTPDQQVPSSVRDWMIADPRYNGWFVGQVASPSPVGAAAEAETPAGSAIVTDGDGATWSESQTVPVLRDYAKMAGVELLSSDNKAEIIAKLREARGDYEVTNEPEPPKE